MAPVPTGVYAITKPGEQMLTLQEGKGDAVILPPTGEPGEQEWQVEALGNGNVHIRNLKHGTYLGYGDEPNVNAPVKGSTEMCEWALYQSAQPFTFHVVVPGGPIDGAELALDASLLRIFPPRTALRPLEVGDQRQAWRFEFRE
ncbi:hypothetical protein [Kitasatospora sp. Root107]|uniref:hypothetical protein n=1 Tax=Kitasatospora sp. Root107 TaxID=1736424 RepID=UPI00070E6D31|nr:hypothetical protein [Kitasatospora sp. Root107]KQV13670.1 hypothetical protein ASC99_33335 [Kitasatospora sp. Root107]